MINQLFLLKDRILQFIGHYSHLIFFCFASILFGGAIYLLGAAVTNGSEDSSKPSPVSSLQKFDQMTIDQIKKLKSSSDPASSGLNLSTIRQNPLVE